MLKILALISIFAISLFAAGDATFEGKRDLNIPAIIMFFVFIAGTLGITYWAARKTDWIISAISTAVNSYKNSGLCLRLVSYGRSKAVVKQLIDAV